MYRECPLRFKLQRIDRVEGFTYFALPCGTAFHRACDDYDLVGQMYPFSHYLDTELEARELELGECEYSRDEDYEWWVVEGESMLKAYRDWRRESGWQVVLVEKEFEFEHTSLAWPHIGAVDRVFETPEEERVLVDLKTSYRIYPSTQLDEYAWILDNDLGIRINKVGYYKARHGKMGRLRVPHWEEYDLVGMVADNQEKIRNDEFPANVGYHCNYCPVRHACPEWSK